MKHYGAILTGDNNIVDGGDSSVLTIGSSAMGNDDKIVIHNENITTTTANAAVASTNGLVIVPTADNRGSTHILGADGREVAITSITGSTASGDFNTTSGVVPVLNITSGAHHFVDSAIESTRAAVTITGVLTRLVQAATNQGVSEIPVAGSQGAELPVGTEFILGTVGAIGTSEPIASRQVYKITGERTIFGTDFIYTISPPLQTSIAAGSTITTITKNDESYTTTITGPLTINSDSTGDQGDLTVAGNAIITGDLTVNGTTTTIDSTTVNVEDRFLTLADTGTATAVTTNITGGIIVEASNDGSGTKTYGGLRWNPTSSSWEFSSDPGADGLSATATWTAFGTATGLTSVQGGNGISINTSSTVDGITGSTASPVVSVDLTSTAVASSSVAGGGLSIDSVSGNGNDTLGIDFGGITPGQLAAETAGMTFPTGRTGLGDGTAGQLLSSRGNGAFAWVAATSGTVAKYAGTHTVSAGGVISITAATHSLTGSDFTISVYEVIDASGDQETGTVTATNRLNQVFPESVTIGRNSGTTDATQEGTVTITLPTTQSNNQFRVVIKS